MTKNTFFWTMLIIGLIGVGLLFWSGLISPTTDDNWEGITGIVMFATSAVSLLALWIGSALKNLGK